MLKYHLQVICLASDSVMELHSIHSVKKTSAVGRLVPLRVFGGSAERPLARGCKHSRVPVVDTYN